MSNFQLLATGPSIHPPFEFRVVGTGFEGRPSVIRRRCERGSKVELIREPDNPHDANAISVHLVWRTQGGNPVTEQIGYVDSALAAEMTDLLFRQALVITSTKVKRLTAAPDMDVPYVTVWLEGTLTEGIRQMSLGEAQP